MSDLLGLMRHWARQSELGRGIRIEAAQLDLLNSIGFFELLATKAAESQRDECRRRIMRSTVGGSTGLNGIDEETEAFAPRSSRLSGTTPPPEETGAAARARRRSAPQRMPSIGSTSSKSAARPSAQPATGRSTQPGAAQ